MATKWHCTRHSERSGPPAQPSPSTAVAAGVRADDRVRATTPSAAGGRGLPWAPSVSGGSMPKHSITWFSPRARLRTDDPVRRLHLPHTMNRCRAGRVNVTRVQTAFLLVLPWLVRREISLFPTLKALPPPALPLAPTHLTHPPIQGFAPNPSATLGPRPTIRPSRRMRRPAAFQIVCPAGRCPWPRPKREVSQLAAGRFPCRRTAEGSSSTMNP